MKTNRLSTVSAETLQELLKNVKLNQSIEIDYSVADVLVRHTYEYEAFKSLHDEIGGNCKNKRYYIEKTGRKGSLMYSGENQEKAKSGIFKITVRYDYIHPANFCQNRYNVEHTFTVCI